jgi:N-acetylmuramoyl-L-alanine amidase
VRRNGFPRLETNRVIPSQSRALNRLLPAMVVLAGVLSGPFAIAGTHPSSAPPATYLPLIAWAARHGFEVEHAAETRDVVVRNRRHRIALQIDACRMSFDGIQVWLSYPMLLQGNRVLLTDRDLTGVLDPLDHPPRLAAGKSVQTVCLDAGHGGWEPGQTTGNRLEKMYTLALAEEVADGLTRCGFKVVMTRRDDAYVDLAERSAIAERSRADLFVSLHYNASEANPAARGVEVYALTPAGARSTNDGSDVGPLHAAPGNASDPENLLLAYTLQRSLVEGLPGVVDRGVRRARFAVLRLARMPAVLIEAGFMSHPGDARWISTSDGRRKTADAVVRGIRKFKDLIETAPAIAPVRPPESPRQTAAAARPEKQ